MKTAAVIVAVALMTGTRTPAKAVIDDSILVRIYDNAGVLISELAAALRTTHEILRRADLGVDWVQCRARRDGPVPAVCDQPLSSGDVVVRLIEGSDKESGERRALGYLPVRCRRCERIRHRLRGPRRLARETGSVSPRAGPWPSHRPRDRASHSEVQRSHRERSDAGGVDGRTGGAESAGGLDVLGRSGR